MLNHLTTACWKKVQNDRLKKQLFFICRALHKSAASDAFGISAAGEGAMPESVISSAAVSEKPRILSLEEMPGPSTLSNLVEFFWRDGFSRIHEIQVMVSTTHSSLCAFCFDYYYFLHIKSFLCVSLKNTKHVI